MQGEQNICDLSHIAQLKADYALTFFQDRRAKTSATAGAYRRETSERKSSVAHLENADLLATESQGLGRLFIGASRTAGKMMWLNTTQSHMASRP